MKKVINSPWIIVILFIIISLAYSLIVPAFNAPDEPFHLEYIQFLAKNKKLTNQTLDNQSISTEGFNPPLYYFIQALFLSILSKDKCEDIKGHTSNDLIDFYYNPGKGFRQDIYPPLNPRYIKWGQGQERNMFLTTKEDRFPFSGSMRVIHALRLFSILCGALTVLFIFKTAYLLFPDNPGLAWLASSLCAFNPQFAFLSGSINNDNLVILWATLSLWLLTGLILTDTRDFDDQRLQNGRGHRLRIVLLGIFAGLGLVTKVNLSSVLVVIILGLIYTSFTLKSSGILKKLKNLSLSFVLFLGPVIILAGWYFIRNISIYGLSDPLGWRLQAIQNPDLVMPHQFRPIFFQKFFLPGIFTSFWGRFDWQTIPMPEWAYLIYGLLSLLGLAGFMYAMAGKNFSKRLKTCFFLYGVAMVVAFTNLVILNFTFMSDQARLIFPVLTGFCLFMATGADVITKYKAKWLGIRSEILVYGLIAFLISLDFYALFWVIYPVYY